MQTVTGSQLPHEIVTHMHTHTHTHTHTQWFYGSLDFVWDNQVSRCQMKHSPTHLSKSTLRPRQITMPIPHHSVFYRPDTLPVAQPTATKHFQEGSKTMVPTAWIYSIQFRFCSPQLHQHLHPHSTCYLNNKTNPLTLDLHWHQYLHCVPCTGYWIHATSTNKGLLSLWTCYPSYHYISCVSASDN